MILLVTVIGLPGVGKSSFCKFLTSQETKYHIIHLKYDDFFLDNYLSLDELQLSNWKKCRTAVSEGLIFFLESFLHNKCENYLLSDQYKPILIKQNVFNFLKSVCPLNNNEKYIFLIDDNFFYRSMRYEVFKIARKHSLSFATVLCQCNINILKERFDNRINNCVSSKSFMRINRLFENPKLTYWEKFVFLINTEIENQSWNELLNFFDVCFNNPFDITADLVNCQVVESSPISVKHRLDNIMRKCVNIIMLNDFKNHGDKLSKIKKEVYEETKNDSMIITKLMYGENENDTLEEIKSIFIYKLKKLL